MSRPIVFLDTETTSLAPDRQIWEIAMIRRQEVPADPTVEGGTREIQRKVASFFVGPVDLRHADPFALKLTRFYDRHPDFRPDQGYGLQNARGRRAFWDLETFEAQLSPSDSNLAQPMCAPDSKVASEVVFHWTRDATIVGAVPNFDTEGLSHMMRHQGLQPAWHYHLRDIETLTVGYLLGSQGPEVDLGGDWKSEELSRLLGVEPPTEEERHTALGDALWVERWWDEIQTRQGAWHRLGGEVVRNA